MNQKGPRRRPVDAEDARDAEVREYRRIHGHFPGEVGS
jgi:hypothetical protein